MSAIKFVFFSYSVHYATQCVIHTFRLSFHFLTVVRVYALDHQYLSQPFRFFYFHYSFQSDIFTFNIIIRNLQYAHSELLFNFFFSFLNHSTRCVNRTFYFPYFCHWFIITDSTQCFIHTFHLTSHFLIFISTTFILISLILSNQSCNVLFPTTFIFVMLLSVLYIPFTDPSIFITLPSVTSIPSISPFVILRFILIFYSTFIHVCNYLFQF